MSAIVFCEICNRACEVAPYRTKTFRTCSYPCGAILRAGGKPAQEAACRYCGKVVLVKPSRAGRPYCDRQCYAASLCKSEEQKAKRDPEARRVSRRRSKVKKVLTDRGFEGEVGDLTTEEWKTILDAYKGRCAYCGEVPKVLSMDHIIPASKGGRHIADNVVPACMACNQSKRDRIIRPSDFPSIVEALT